MSKRNTRLIELSWAIYKENCISDRTSDEVAEIKRAFFTGANVVLGLAKAIYEEGRDIKPSEVIVNLEKEIETELES